MKKNFWLIVFLVALLVDIVFMQSGIPFRIFSKPLIVASLIIYFILQTSPASSFLKRSIIAALFFSLVGDVLLLFESKGSVFFMLGLSSFLIAHIFYIVAFNKLRKQEKISFKNILILPVLVYYAGLIIVLYDHLDAMKIPVLIYGMVISAMLVMSIHLKDMQSKQMSKLLLTGAVLFILSDSILAFNKFYHSWSSAGMMIMLSYGLAQLFITISVAKLIRSKKKKSGSELVHS